jgi:hypothetical protein
MSNTWVIVATLAGGVVGLVVSFFLFRASIALADVTDPGLLKSILVVLVAVAVCAGAGIGLYYLFRLNGPAETDRTSIYVLWALCVMLVSWVAPALLYIPALPVKWFQGVQIAGVEVLLRSLLAALVTGVVLVVLAFIQGVSQRATPPKSTLSPPPAVQPTAVVPL